MVSEETDRSLVRDVEICPTQRAATVLFVKAVAVFYLVGNEQELALERLLVARHRIQDGEKLPHASGESDFLLFATFQQLLVLCPDQGVITSSHQGRHI